MRALVHLLVALLIGVPVLASALTITRPLAVGSRGADVTALQEFLISTGYLKVSATGYFGVLTKGAVAALQTNNGLEPVGSVGPKTRALVATLTAISPTPAPTPIPAAPPPTPTPPPTPPVVEAPTSTAPDANPPLITVVAPPTVLPRDTYITDMIVTTNKDASCRWGTLTQMQFSSMTNFANTGKTTHSHTFSNLGNGNLYVYYVKCVDMQDRQSSEMTVSFSISNSATMNTDVSALSAAAANASSLDQLKAVLEQMSSSLQAR